MKTPSKSTPSMIVHSGGAFHFNTAMKILEMEMK